jgi:molecular chaperone DnaK
LDRINAAKESLSKIANKIGSEIYAQTNAAGAGTEGGAGENPGQAGGNAGNAGGEKVVDADYTVVDDKK